MKKSQNSIPRVTDGVKAIQLLNETISFNMGCTVTQVPEEQIFGM
jgi:hypothetical protein